MLKLDEKEAFNCAVELTKSLLGQFPSEGATFTKDNAYYIVKFLRDAETYLLAEDLQDVDPEIQE